jgi:predicted HTH domain antitoxin
MVLEIDESILEKSQMSESDIRLELALSLFDKKSITLGQASKIAGLDSESFMHKAKERGIFYPYRSKTNPKWQPLSLNMEKFPKNVNHFAVNQTELSALKELFKDEPSAEELCKML